MAEQTNVEVKHNELFIKTMEEIKKIIPQEFLTKSNKSGVTWFGAGRTRLLKMVETKRGLRVEFNTPVSKVEGLVELSIEEAKAKHMGTCRWIYTGADTEVVKKLVQEAISKFEPKQRADAKAEKDKNKAKKDETPKVVELNEKQKQDADKALELLKEQPKVIDKKEIEKAAHRRLNPEEIKAVEEVKNKHNNKNNNKK